MDKPQLYSWAHQTTLGPIFPAALAVPATLFKHHQTTLGRISDASLRDPAFASPGIAQLAFQTTAMGPNALRIVETILALLAEAGVGPASAAWAVHILTVTATAIAVENSDGANPADPDGPVTQALNRASASDYPRLQAAREHMLSGTGEQRFAWMMDILIRGILSSSAESGRASEPPSA